MTAAQVLVLVAPEEAERAASICARVGDGEPVRLDGSNGSRFERRWQAARERCERLRSLKGTLEIDVPSGEPEPESAAEPADLAQAEAEVSEHEAQWQALHRDRQALDRLRERREFLARCGLDARKLARLCRTFVTVGTVPTDQVGRVTLPHRRTPLAIHLRPDGERTLVLAAAEPVHAARLRHLLDAVFYEEVVGPRELEEEAWTDANLRGRDQALAGRRERLLKDRKRLRRCWGQVVASELSRVESELRHLELLHAGVELDEHLLFSTCCARDKIEAVFAELGEQLERPHAALASPGGGSPC
jgi:hypothetical protein